jgi:hypothetical protein
MPVEMLAVGGALKLPGPSINPNGPDSHSDGVTNCHMGENERTSEGPKTGCSDE